MRSVAVLPGTVQVPPDGQPIVLLADAQTIGGYPVIGHVIAADLPVAAQLRPGDLVCWRQATIEEATGLKKKVEPLLALERRVDDLEVLIELTAAETDPAPLWMMRKQLLRSAGPERNC